MHDSLGLMDTGLFGVDAWNTRLDIVLGAVGMGSFAGLGVPVLVLVVGTLATFGLLPAFLGPYAALPMFSATMTLAAGIYCLCAAVAHNTKLTKTVPLVGHVVGMPFSWICSALLPVLAAMSALEHTARVADLHNTMPAAPQVAWGTVAAAAALALLCSTLVSLARVATKVLVWLSPVPFVDAMLNAAFIGYTIGVAVLAVLWPAAAVAFFVLQAVVIAAVLPGLWRALKTAWAVAGGVARNVLVWFGVPASGAGAPAQG